MKNTHVIAALSMTAASIFGTNAFAQNWSEFGNGGSDAGMFTNSAQITNGTGPLLTISGNMATRSDVDVFKINITGSNFSAIHTGGSNFDSIISLFDANGYGVAYGDQTGTGFRGGVFGVPVSPGLYYLAISYVNQKPADANGNLLFNSNPNNIVHTPDGPGAANPLASWVGSGGSTAVGDYNIVLTGATYAVPAPASVGLLAMAGVFATRRRR